MKDMYPDHISFSQLSTVEECPYAYFLQKIINIESVPNAFAQAGSLAHDLLAGWARGEIPIKQLPVQWIQRFTKEVTAEFPHFLVPREFGSKLFDSILTYFENFDGFPGYEIVGVEKEFHSSIGDQHFVGIVDLILRSKETNGLMVVDHKSCSLSSFKKNKDQMYKQLLLYSKHCADEFGEFPEKLCFNLFKENTYDERPFDREDYVCARLWAENVIREMQAKDVTDWFETKPNLFRCVNLCNCRNECVFGKPENHRRKEDCREGKRNTVAVL